MSHPHSLSTPVQRALWYIESHFNRALTLDEIAAAACVSPFHLVRGFGMATGLSVMRYVRARRLAVAAIALANGARDVLTVALDSGYGSHEAFTRAFREQFGATPADVRERASLAGLSLQEPITMPGSPSKERAPALLPPRMETRGAFRLAGLNQRYTYATYGGIPGQWQRFVPQIAAIRNRIGAETYGVIHNADEDGSIDYLCGVPVENPGTVPSSLVTLQIPAARYAVFVHQGHVSAINTIWQTIWNELLPDLGYEPGDGPEFERYGARFDAQRGYGEVEIWIPLARHGGATVS